MIIHVYPMIQQKYVWILRISEGGYWWLRLMLEPFLGIHTQDFPIDNFSRYFHRGEHTSQQFIDWTYESRLLIFTFHQHLGTIHRKLHDLVFHCFPNQDIYVFGLLGGCIIGSIYDILTCSLYWCIYIIYIYVMYAVSQVCSTKLWILLLEYHFSREFLELPSLDGCRRTLATCWGESGGFLHWQLKVWMICTPVSQHANEMCTNLTCMIHVWLNDCGIYCDFFYRFEHWGQFFTLPLPKDVLKTTW